jgi:hypothetical protein
VRKEETKAYEEWTAEDGRGEIRKISRGRSQEELSGSGKKIRKRNSY